MKSYILVLLVFLSGCVANAKPDRLLNFNITVKTPDSGEINFSGHTFCEHISGWNEGVGFYSGYKTVNPYSLSNNNEQAWMLEGIDCNLAIDKSYSNESFVLYKIINNSYAAIYYVNENGNATLVGDKQNRYSSSVTLGIKKELPIPYKKKYGPYAFYKRKLSELPITIGEIIGPTIINTNNYNYCKQENNKTHIKTVSLADFSRIRPENYLDKGFLKYRSDKDVWVPNSGFNFETGIDVSLKESKDSNCVTILIDGISFSIKNDYQQTIIYLPDKKVSYEFEYVPSLLYKTIKRAAIEANEEIK